MKLDPLEYVLNRMEAASRMSNPAEYGYGKDRKELLDGIAELRAQLCMARGDFQFIVEYWNGNSNLMAMDNALEEIIRVATAALSSTGPCAHEGAICKAKTRLDHMYHVCNMSPKEIAEADNDIFGTGPCRHEEEAKKLHRVYQVELSAHASTTRNLRDAEEEAKRLREEMRSWSINGGPNGSTTVCPECKRDVGWTAAGLCYDCIVEAKAGLRRRAKEGNP